jgi:hypothetical protein
VRRGLARDVPAKRPGTILLATWNIRMFGALARREGAKGRTDEAIYAIAEILSHFDLIAVQELRADMEAFRQVMRLLGRTWDRIYSDVSFDRAGNSERMAFVWDRTRVDFAGLAGEIVLERGAESEQMSQLARTPFICGFQCGWSRVNLCSVHIYYGQAKAEDPRRVAEIAAVAHLLAKKARTYITLDRTYRNYMPENLVLLGDFNIFSPADSTFGALKAHGFVVPDALAKNQLLGSNVERDKFYDQIAFYRELRDIESNRAGIFDFYQYIYRSDQAARFLPDRPQDFEDWRTYQLSDHLVMWVELGTDKTEDYFADLLKPQRRGVPSA